MQIAILGFGPAALYAGSRLAAEGLEVGLFGTMPKLLPEFVSKEAIEEFQLHDFVLTKINRIAEFDENFELRERMLKGAVIDSNAIMRNLLIRAVKYGAEVLAGSTIDTGEKTKLKWLDRSLEVEPEFIIVEESMGRSVLGAEVARIPFNKDTIEFYKPFNMLILPAGETAIVYGNLDFSWHKFENAAVLDLIELFVPPPREPIEGRIIRVGRAAGHASGFGWLIEEGLYYGRLLTEAILRYEDGNERALDVYRRSARVKERKTI